MFCLPVVIVPEMIFGSFLMSSKHAIGIPQFATGPQKWVLQRKSYSMRMESVSTSTDVQNIDFKNAQDLKPIWPTS